MHPPTKKKTNAYSLLLSSTFLLKLCEGTIVIAVKCLSVNENTELNKIPIEQTCKRFHFSFFFNF